jgi:hypothetical protein
MAQFPDAELRAQMAALARLPTLPELIALIRTRPPHDGPPSAAIVRADRDDR